MKKIFACLLLLLVSVCPTFAEEAPIQTAQEVAPILMPFRVWVLPGWNNGVQTAGHYEYFEMLVPIEGLSLVSPVTEPVIPTP
jgi:hypothetical protein